MPDVINGDMLAGTALAKVVELDLEHQGRFDNLTVQDMETCVRAGADAVEVFCGKGAFSDTGIQIALAFVGDRFAQRAILGKEALEVTRRVTYQSIFYKNYAWQKGWNPTALTTEQVREIKDHPLFKDPFTPNYDSPFNTLFSMAAAAEIGNWENFASCYLPDHPGTKAIGETTPQVQTFSMSTTATFFQQILTSPAETEVRSPEPTAKILVHPNIDVRFKNHDGKWLLDEST